MFNADWGTVEQELSRALQARGIEAKIHNMAVPAHTSLDSLYKYQALRKKEFDAVVFYHSINELRANNCPPKVFRDNYSHYHWYREVNMLFKHPELPFLTFPYMLHRGGANLKNRFAPSAAMPMYPLEGWMKYGGDIKTAQTLKVNLEKVILLARKKQEIVILPTFCFYIPDNYSLEAFQNKALDYGNHRSPIEVWGTVEHVAAGLEKHNEVILSLSGQTQGVRVIDMNPLIPKNQEYFNDICHLTPQGSKAFVEYMMPALLESLR